MRVPDRTRWSRGGHQNTKAPVRLRLLLWEISRSIVGVGGAEGVPRLLLDRGRDIVKLFGLRRAGKRGRRSGTVRDDVLHFVEIAGADETLVLCGGITVLALAFKLGFLQLRV